MKKIEVFPQRVFTGHNSAIYGLTGDFNQEKLYTSESRGHIVEWNISKQLDNTDGVLILRNDAPVFCLYYIFESGILLAGDSSGALISYDTVRRKLLYKIQISKGAIFDIKYLFGKILLAAQDGKIYQIDLDSGKIVLSQQVGKASLRKIELADDGKNVYIASSDCMIYNIDIEQLTTQYTLSGHTNSVFSLAYDTVKKRLISGGRDARLRIFGNEYKSIDIAAHTLHIHDIKLDINQRICFTSSMDKCIRIWDLDTLELVKVIDRLKFNSHTSSVNRLMWNFENGILYSVSDDRTLREFEIKIS